MRLRVRNNLGLLKLPKSRVFHTFLSRNCGIDGIGHGIALSLVTVSGVLSESVE